MFGRWSLKDITYNGASLLDAPITFVPGQLMRNVQVVFTDRRTEVAFQVSDETGQLTREYVALIYPVDKTQWPQTARIFVGPTIDPAAAARPVPTMTGGSVMPGMTQPPRREAMSGLRAGEYYAVAVDDMQAEDVRDTVVLEALRASATRVTVVGGSSIDVPLRRVKFSDAVRR
jgi:hypothetical protein